MYSEETPLIKAGVERSPNFTKALSSRVSAATDISAKDFTLLISGEVGSKTFPFTVVIFKSGSIPLNDFNATSENPFNMDNTHIVAIVAIAMPATDINEIILIALCDFFEKIYRLAM